MSIRGVSQKVVVILYVFYEISVSSSKQSWKERLLSLPWNGSNRGSQGLSVVNLSGREHRIAEFPVLLSEFYVFRKFYVFWKFTYECNREIRWEFGRGGDTGAPRRLVETAGADFIIYFSENIYLEQIRFPKCFCRPRFIYNLHMTAQNAAIIF